MLLEAAGPQITIPGDTTEHTFGSLVQAVLTGTFKLPTPPPVHTKPAEEKKRTMQLHVSRITELIQYSGLHGGEVEDFVQKAAERHVENIIKFDKALLHPPIGIPL